MSISSAQLRYDRGPSYVEIINSIKSVTELGAKASAEYIGSRNKFMIDKVAVDSMNKYFTENQLYRVHVAIGEGEKDEAPMFTHGEVLGDSKYIFDLGIDPIDGTSAASEGRDGAISVVALAEYGSMMKWHDIHYTNKIVVGDKVARLLDRNGPVRIDLSPLDNLTVIADGLEKHPRDLRVAVLNRPRNKEIIDSIYEIGANPVLLDGGDIVPSIEACTADRQIDVMYGSGGSPEAILSAAGIAGLNGNIQAMLHPQDLREQAIARKLGKLDKILYLDDLIGQGPVYFCLTAVTKYKNWLESSTTNNAGTSYTTYSQSR